MKSFIITKVYNCLVLRFFFLFFSPKCEHIIEKRFWHAFPTNAYLANASTLGQQTAFIHSRWRKKVSLNVERVFSELKSVIFFKSKRGKKTEKKFKGGVYDAALVFITCLHYDYHYEVCLFGVKTTVCLHALRGFSMEKNAQNKHKL